MIHFGKACGILCTKETRLLKLARTLKGKYVNLPSFGMPSVISMCSKCY